MSGVKETKELLVAVLAVAPAIIKAAKDGIQISDAVEVYGKVVGDPVVKDKISAAIENVKLVPEEVKDLNFAEVVEIISAVLPEISAAIAATRE